jgi:hypothetical protein
MILQQHQNHLQLMTISLLELVMGEIWCLLELICMSDMTLQLAKRHIMKQPKELQVIQQEKLKILGQIL